MALDAHKNFAYSTIATAPSPALSGTSLVVAAGQGALFPAVPFNVTIWPIGQQPLTTNAEIVRVTAIVTDTLTITRAQEGSAALSIIVGDQIAATITALTFTDIEAQLTGNSVYVVGDLLYAGTTAALSRLADVAAGAYLRSGGVGVAPLWSTLKLPNTAPVSAILYASAANVISALPTENSGILVTSTTGVPTISSTLTYNTTTGDFRNTLSQNSATLFLINNSNAGGAANAYLSAHNGTSGVYMQSLGTGFTTSGLLLANKGRITTNSAAGLLISASNVAATTIVIAIGGEAVTDERARVDKNGVHFFSPLMGISYKVQTNGLVGRTTLVLGTKAITITGLTTSHKAWVQLQAIGGTIAAQYRAVCTSNTLTIDAITSGGIVQTLDTSTIEYICILTT